MKIGGKYSHLNGLEWLLYHHSEIWDEITAVIAAVDAGRAKTKVF